MTRHTGHARRGGQRWALSILLHLAIVGLIVGGWYWAAHRPPAVQSLGIEARVVSADELDKPEPRSPPPMPEPQPEEPPAEEASPEIVQEPDPGPTEEELAAQAEQARVAEERRLAQEKEAAERKAAAAKAEQERREKAERERKERLERERKQEEERKRLAREQAQKAREEAARRQREAELSEQLAAEERRESARAKGLLDQYIAQITARIERNWIRPPSAGPGVDCEVRVTQVPGGTVTGVTVGRCNADDAVRQSIETAVHKASPLPEPPDPALFDRNLRFNFRPTK